MLPTEEASRRLQLLRVALQGGGGIDRELISGVPAALLGLASRVAVKMNELEELEELKDTKVLETNKLDKVEKKKLKKQLEKKSKDRGGRQKIRIELERMC